MSIKEDFTTILPTKDESSFLKLLAIIFMTVDHIGFILFPGVLWLRIVGRLAFPLFIYQFGISVQKTKHFGRMGRNLFIFALISQPVYWLVNKGNFSRLNIFFTLFLTWLIIFLYKKIIKNSLRCLIMLPIFIFLLLPYFIPNFLEVDYGLYGVLMLLSFAAFVEKPIMLNLSFVFLSISFCYLQGSFLQIFCLYSIPLFYLRLPFKKKIPNILYYTYYPLHLTILALIAKIFIQK